MTIIYLWTCKNVSLFLRPSLRYLLLALCFSGCRKVLAIGVLVWSLATELVLVLASYMPRLVLSRVLYGGYRTSCMQSDIEMLVGYHLKTILYWMFTLSLRFRLDWTVGHCTLCITFMLGSINFRLVFPYTCQILASLNWIVGHLAIFFFLSY